MIKQQTCAKLAQQSSERNSVKALISEVEELKRRVANSEELESEKRALVEENEALEKNYAELSAKLAEINEAMNLLEDTNKELLQRSELCESNNEELANKVATLETDMKLKDEALIKAQKVIEELYKDLISKNHIPELERPHTTTAYTETDMTPTINQETLTETPILLNKATTTDSILLREEFLTPINIAKELYATENVGIMTDVVISEEKLMREIKILRSEREMIETEMVKLREDCESVVEGWKQAAFYVGKSNRTELSPLVKSQSSIIMTMSKVEGGENHSIRKESDMQDPLMQLVITELEKALTEDLNYKHSHIKELEAILHELLESVSPKESKEDQAAKGMCAILFELFKLLELYNSQTQSLKSLLCDKKEMAASLVEENERLKTRVKDVSEQLEQLRENCSAILAHSSSPEEVKKRLELLIILESECKKLVGELKQYNGIKQNDSRVITSNVAAELQQQVLILKTQLEVSKAELLSSNKEFNKEVMKYKTENEQKEAENKALRLQLENLSGKINLLVQKKQEEPLKNRIESRPDVFVERSGQNVPIERHAKSEYESASSNKVDFSITICTNCDSLKTQLNNASNKLEKYKQKFQKRVREFDNVLQYVSSLLSGSTEEGDLISKIILHNPNVSTWLSNIREMVAGFRVDRQRYKDFLKFVLNLLDKATRQDKLQKLTDRSRYGKGILEAEKMAAEGLQEFFRAHSKCSYLM
eukprot:TRINITY_DN15528_c0_g1_i3.p1 TRINITY_DN15528_c0_g1~~TRINITY_DN15528_c0_g1_i3.p1  ORF type:complete len:715 (+),score=157.42 TRINITY_DN15528_c0_g1_i3:335-2479(+)